MCLKTLMCVPGVIEESHFLLEFDVTNFLFLYLNTKCHQLENVGSVD